MRRSILFVIPISMLILVFAVQSPAREAVRKDMTRMTDWSPGSFSGDLFELNGKIQASAAVDTFNIVSFDFEYCNWQGWTRFDFTAQRDTFFHVDDFQGLGGGASGKLVPIEGSKSIWCGARDSDEEYMCGWATAPGYGDNWDQRFVTEKISFRGPVVVSYHGVFDSEPECDFTILEYNSNLMYPWVEIARYDGQVDTVAAHTLYPAGLLTKLRFRFVSDGAWSDEDGLFASDGAAIIDSVTVSDLDGVINFEDFESYPVGTKETALWEADAGDPSLFELSAFGKYSSLGSNLQEKDPCRWNPTYQVVFFNEDCPPSSEYPGLYVTPFCHEDFLMDDQVCQNEAVISPYIDMTRYSTGNNEIQDADIPPGDLEDLGGTMLKFTVYADLPYSNLVFYNWMVRDIVNGCPQNWEDRGFGYGGSDPDFRFSMNSIGDLVSADTIQIALQIIDMCEVWFDVYGDCAEHTTSPYFDNVSIQRYKANGPQWSWRAMDLFQDNFPSTDDVESWVRADAANDIRPGSDPAIDPGDSIVVTCTSPLGGGIAEDGGGARVYMHLKCGYICSDGLKTDIAGSSLEGTYGHYVSDDGMWTVIQGDTALVAGNPQSDKYMFDLNDSLLSRGYMIEYYFKAYDNEGESTTLPDEAETAGEYPYWGGSRHFEFTCLPTLESGGWLFVDDFDGRGTMEGIVQNYWDPTFEAVEYYIPDRYDVASPSSGLCNGPGSRARQAHLDYAYDKIIWDSGNLQAITISDGTSISDKSNDCQMLIDWLSTSDHRTGLLVMGDNVAYDLFSLGGVAATLLAGYCGTSFMGDSYFEASGGFEDGGTANPEATSVDYPDFSYYLYGGCSRTNSFDMLGKTGPGEYAYAFPPIGESDCWVGIRTDQLNLGSHVMRTIFMGHSIMSMRGGEGDLLKRNIFLNYVSDYLDGSSKEDYTGEDIPAVTSLVNNYPNPFNPATTIVFGLAAKGHVSLKVYDAAGRLVRTLVDGERDAGFYREAWDGTNNSGSAAASGVYFCRMTAGGYGKNIKLVLLK